MQQLWMAYMQQDVVESCTLSITLWVKNDFCSMSQPDHDTATFNNTQTYLLIPPSTRGSIIKLEHY